jgi:hypothetical protein
VIPTETFFSIFSITHPTTSSSLSQLPDIFNKAIYNSTDRTEEERR